LNLIDLMSERHIQLRKLLGKRWNESNGIYLSNSEWFILTRIYQEGQTTISFVTKQVDISRQATHKFIKRLTEKGLVVVDKMENNKKEKSITLTEMGKECYEKNEALKVELETEIKSEIGAENVERLKEIMKLDWGKRI